MRSPRNKADWLTVICRSLMLLQLHNSSQQVVQVSPGRNRWTMRTIKHSFAKSCHVMSQDSLHYRGLCWFCWSRIALWPSVKMLFYSMAPLKPGLSFSWTFNWVQVKKNTQCHPPPKKKSWSNFLALPLLSLWGERSKTTRRKQLMQSTRFVFSPSLMPTSFDCTLQQMWRSNQIDFLDS